MVVIEVVKDFFVELDETTVEGRVYVFMENARKALETMRNSAYDSDEYKKAYHSMDVFSYGWEGEGYGTGLLDHAAYVDAYKPFWKPLYALYCERDAIESENYRRRYEREFLERFKNGMPSDDELDFLSDWHKDLYGYRPRGERWQFLVALAQGR